MWEGGLQNGHPRPLTSHPNLLPHPTFIRAAHCWPRPRARPSPSFWRCVAPAWAVDRRRRAFRGRWVAVPGRPLATGSTAVGGLVFAGRLRGVARAAANATRPCVLVGAACARVPRGASLTSTSLTSPPPPPRRLPGMERKMQALANAWLFSTFKGLWPETLKDDNATQEIWSRLRHKQLLRNDIPEYLYGVARRSAGGGGGGGGLGPLQRVVLFGQRPGGAWRTLGHRWAPGGVLWKCPVGPGQGERPPANAARGQSQGQRRGHSAAHTPQAPRRGVHDTRGNRKGNPPPRPPKTRSGPQRVRMSGGERPIGAAKGKPSDTEALCQPPPPPESATTAS